MTENLQVTAFSTKFEKIGVNRRLHTYSDRKFPVFARANGTNDTSSAHPPQGLARLGVTYSPYKATGECKSQAEIDDDFERFANQYHLVRLYGTDCDQVGLVSNAAKRHGNILFLGVWNPDSLEDEIRVIVSAVGND